MLRLVLLLNPVYITLFWAIVLNSYSENKGTPKSFLGKFMIAAFVLYVSHLFYFTEQYNIYRFFDGFYTLAMLLVYPLYHIYIRLLTVDSRFSISKHYPHFIIPLIVFLVHTVIYFMMSPEQQIEFFSKVLTGKGEAEGISFYMLSIANTARLAFIIQVLYYLVKNFNLIIKNSQRVQQYYSNIEGMELHWVQFINISLAITSISSVFLAIAGREAFADNVLALSMPSIIFSFMLFFIGLLGNTQQAVPVEDMDNQEKEEFNLEVSNSSILYEKRLKAKLEKLFTEEKLFKSPFLKIWEVSKLLGTNRTYVSRMINNEYGQNFCNFVNNYRVKHVKQLLKENPSLTNDQIVELSGFGSINSLYRAFQNIEGISLKQYRKKLPGVAQP